MSQLISFTEALHTIQNQCQCLVETETIELTNALNRTLADDIIAPINVPPADNSAMDGYALNVDDWQADKPLPVSQRIAAGSVTQLLSANTCARIFTGAEIPVGANAVVMQENALLEGDNVLFSKQPKQGDNIRPQGQDTQKGDVVFQKGLKLEAQHLGMLANLGLSNIVVFKRLKVAILTTGDELITAGEPLKQGQIYNSNGPMMSALVQQLGHQVSHYQHAVDDPDTIESTLKTMAESADYIISSGGVSVGEEDHVKAVIEKNGVLSLWKIAIKPGKPLVHGKVFDTPFLGLPGNPSSTLVTFHFFARLALAISAGQYASLPAGFAIEAGFDREKVIQRDEFLRVNIHDNIAIAHPQQSSGALHAACVADGYLHIPAGSSIKKGKRFTYFPFSSF